MHGGAAASRDEKEIYMLRREAADPGNAASFEPVFQFSFCPCRGDYQVIALRNFVALVAEHRAIAIELEAILQAARHVIDSEHRDLSNCRLVESVDDPARGLLVVHKGGSTL